MSKAKLFIPAEIEERIHTYVRSVDTEIAGMGEATIDEYGNIVMTDIAIYDQEVTSGTADLSSESLAKFQMELIEQGKSPKNWIVWWHSHAHMDAFFSGRDTATIDSSNEFSHMVSLVVNKRRERRARVDTYHPFRFTESNIDIIVGKTKEEDVPEAIKTEVEQKVHIKSWGPYTGKVNLDAEEGGNGIQVMGFQQKGKELAKIYPAKLLDNYSGVRNDKNDSEDIITSTNASQMEDDEVIAVVEGFKELIEQKLHDGLGDDDQEIIDLRTDLADWEYELQARQDIDVALKDF
jgi:proteasome lid subunit RPN8/RPN11